VQHELMKVARWGPAHPHLPRWKAECLCWWVSRWVPTAREALDLYDAHVARHTSRAA